MNILIVADKPDAKMYKSVFKTAPNTTVLGTVTHINSDFIRTLKDKYNPHAVVIDTSVKCKSTTVSQTVDDIIKYYPYMQILIMTDADDNTEFHTPFVVNGPISNLSLLSVLARMSNHSQKSKSGDSSKDIADKKREVDKLSTLRPYNLYNKKYRAKVKRFNPVWITAGVLLLLVIVLIPLIIFNFNATSNNATPDETTTTATVSDILDTTVSVLETVAESTNLKETAPTNRQDTDSIKSQESTKSSSPKLSSNNNQNKEVVNSESESSKKTNENNEDNYENTDNENDTSYEEHGSAVISYGSDSYRNSHSDEVSSIKLSYNSKTLQVGDTLNLSANISPASASQNVIWNSSNSSVVSVSNGRITAHKQGIADITATTSNGKSASCRVTVNAKNKGTTVKLSATSYHLSVGQSAKITLYNATNCQWSTSRSSVAKVSNTGRNSANITAQHKGSADISVIDSNTGIRYICKVTVN